MSPKRSMVELSSSPCARVYISPTSLTFRTAFLHKDVCAETIGEKLKYRRFGGQKGNKLCLFQVMNINYFSDTLFRLAQINLR